MKKLYRILFALMMITAVCLGRPALAQAAPTGWQPIGPYGGQVNVMVMASGPGNTLFAGTKSRGVWRSMDGGLHWTQASEGMGNRNVGALLADLVHPDVLYAGADLRIFKTMNGGTTWAQVGENLDSSLTALVAAAEGTLLAGTHYNGVLRSTDGGANWTSVNHGLPSGDSTEVNCLAVDPTNPRVVYAGLNTGAIYKTVDLGDSWTAVTTPDGTDPQPIRFMAIRTVNASTPPHAPLSVLFAADYLFLYRSTNGGQTWKQSEDFPGVISSLAFDPVSPLIYVSSGGDVFKGSVGNDLIWLENWAAIAPAGQVMYETVLAPGKAVGQLYASSYTGGVWFTADAGSTWADRTTGLPLMQVNSIALHPQAPGLIVAAAYEGVYLSADSGQTWRRTADISPNNEVAIFDPHDPDVLYVMNASEGVYKSVDRGLTFQVSNTGLDDKYLVSATIDPQQPQTLYVGTESMGVYKSIDGGAHWGAATVGLGSGEVLAVAVHPANSNVLYAGVEDDGLYRSLNAGAIWQKIDLGTTDARAVYAIAFAPSNPDYIYVGVRWKIVRSKDGGATWQTLPANPDHLHSEILVDPANPESVYIDSDDRVLFSSDAGDEWLDFTKGALSANAYVTALAFDPLHPGRMLVGTGGAGIYVHEQPITYLPLLIR